MTMHTTTIRDAGSGRCVHHWIVEPPGGPTSGARCKQCGEERDFINNPDAVTVIETRNRGSQSQPAAENRTSKQPAP